MDKDNDPENRPSPVEMENQIEKDKKLYEEQLRQEEEKMKLPHYREALRLAKEAEDLAMTQKRHDPEKALRLAHEAAALHPGFRDRVRSVENWNSYWARKGKVNIKKAVREVLRPHMLELGFTEMVPRAEDVVPQWIREYAHAMSRLDPRQKYPLENKSAYFFRENAFLTVGAARGGNALSLYAGKKIGGHIEEFTKTPRTDPDYLIYLNQEELCEALRRLNDYIDEYFIPWITD